MSANPMFDNEGYEIDETGQRIPGGRRLNLAAAETRKARRLHPVLVVAIAVILTVAIVMGCYWLVAGAYGLWQERQTATSAPALPTETLAAAPALPTETLAAAPALPTETLAAPALPTETPTETATPEPTATTVVVTNTTIVAGPTLPVTGTLFYTPVKATSVFNDASGWIIAEPGVICNPECPWTVMATNASWYGNASEGGFLYISAGQLKIDADGVTFDLPYVTGNNYVVIVRGRIDDGMVDTDRNMSVVMYDFVPGHAIFSTMPNGAYVSKNWVKDQLASSMNVTNASTSKTNCGALGCTQTTVLLLDLDTHFYQKWLVKAESLTNWSLVETNGK